MKSSVESPPRTKAPLWFELLEPVAKSYPDSPAIVDETRMWTYRELNEAANKLAHYLLSLEAGPEKLIGIYLPRSFEFAQAFFAIGKSSAAVMPIDVATPIKRVQTMIEKTKPSLIITNTIYANTLSNIQTPKILIDDPELPWKSFPPFEPKTYAIPGGLSYVFFTSGSSGTPNGVEMPFVTSANYQTKGTESLLNETILFRSNVGFTLVLRELSWTLSNGGQVYIVKQGEENNLEKLIQLIAKHSVRRLFFSPTFLNALLNYPIFKNCKSIEEIYTVGESLQPEIRKRVFKVFPNAIIFDYYGCTEAPALTLQKITAKDDCALSIFLGEEQLPQHIIVLDANRQPSKVGEVGEIYAGGNLARGYRNNPNLTAERFLKNPFSDIPGERLYRTGDLARKHADGKIEFLGRRDQQIQIRGARVEINEIRYAIRQHPGVRDAVVFPLNHNNNDILIAFVSKDPEQLLDLSQLRNYLLNAIPAYMVPAFIAILDSLPLNANNKIDYPLLKEKAKAKMTDNAQRKLSNRLEQILSGLFAKALKVESVGRDDSFFVLGGDSLAAIELTIHIERKLRISLEPRDIYMHPTVSLLARRLQESEHENTPRRFALVASNTQKKAIPVFAINLTEKLAATAFSEHQTYHAAGIWGETKFNFNRAIETYAEEYVADIKHLCQQDRLNLVGYSYGGLVAYQCAQRLSEQGKSIERLVIIEPITPTEKRRCRWNSFQAYRAGRTLPGHGGTVMRAMIAQGISFYGMPVSHQFSGSAAKVYCMLAENAAELKPYHGRVDLVVGKDFTEEQMKSWKKNVNDLTIHYLPEDHWQLANEENVKKWADIISQNQF